MSSKHICLDAIRAIDKVLDTPNIRPPAAPHNRFSTSVKNSYYQMSEHSKKAFKQIVEGASEALEAVNTGLTFTIYEGTGRPVIQLVELQTNEVIREIPPEKMSDIVAGIQEWTGLIVDRKE